VQTVFKAGSSAPNMGAVGAFRERRSAIVRSRAVPFFAAKADGAVEDTDHCCNSGPKELSGL
jgi:hypothetical protein